MCAKCHYAFDAEHDPEMSDRQKSGLLGFDRTVSGQLGAKALHDREKQDSGFAAVMLAHRKRSMRTLLDREKQDPEFAEFMAAQRKRAGRAGGKAVQKIYAEKRKNLA
jgi:hypothetical protein